MQGLAMKQEAAAGQASVFYKFAPSYTGGSHGLELENKDALKAPGQFTFGPPNGRFGFWEYPEPPRLRPNKKTYKRPPRDLEACGAYWLVSQRLKDVLCAIDPAGTAFVECEVYHISGKRTEQKHYFFDVIREIDALDVEASKLVIKDDDGDPLYATEGVVDLIFKKEAVGDAHIFRQRWMGGVICDSVLKASCFAAGIKDPELFNAVNPKKTR
jgi:hypothetical protein